MFNIEYYSLEEIWLSKTKQDCLQTQMIFGKGMTNDNELVENILFWAESQSRTHKITLYGFGDSLLSQKAWVPLFYFPFQRFFFMLQIRQQGAALSLSSSN